MSDKISNFGFKFQAKIIACLMIDAGFVGQIYDLLKLEYFESDSVSFLIEKSLAYFDKYKRVPTLEVLKVDIDSITDDLLKQEVISTLKEACKSATATDLEFIKEKTVDFCKNQELKNAIIESVPLLQKGDYESIKDLVDTALKVGMDSNIGLDYFDDIPKRYMEDARQPISTGWNVIDEITKGGIGPGELAVAIAPSGAGKSWLLAAVGANSMKQGRRVVHYTLELSENYTGWRYDCILSGISLDKIHLHVDKVETALKDIPGELIIKWYPTKSVSLMGIRSHITKLKMLDKAPDVVIIDYADLLKFGNSKMAKHEMLEALYEELRGFAGEYQVPVWTVSQSNREGLNSDIIEADKAAGAYAKIFPADFVLSLSRKAQDKLSNTARIHIIKNRFGLDGVTFPVHMDTSRGHINIHAETSEQGKAVSNTMQTDSEYDKRMLRKRLGQLPTKSEHSSSTNRVTNLF